MSIRDRLPMATLSIALGLALTLFGPTPQAAAEGPNTAELSRASDAVLGVRSVATEGAASIDTLGERRVGSGVVIGSDGLVLTIGYLILEADEVELQLDSGKRIPARIVAYDLASGFGLLQALLPLDVAPAPLGESRAVSAGEPLLVVSGGDAGKLSVTWLASRRSYSGYWEYHIDGALFTAPARTDHSGAGLFNARGQLVGVGSLLVPDAPGRGEKGTGNMFVPIDLLPPIFAELRERGLSRASQRAWLGVSCSEQPDGLRVLRISRDSPAEAAGLQPGDLITRLDGTPVRDLEAFYKQLWGGGIERELVLQVQRGGAHRDVPVRSVDRMQLLRRAPGI